MFSPLTFLLALVAVVNAHFRLQYPPPRGEFNAANEVNFCDSYNSVGNRTTFPLEGGFYTLKAGHPHFTVGVIVSTADNPTSFNNFTQLTSYARSEDAGTFCYPLNFTTPTNATAFRDGQNVTIQIVFEGGDGKLYQCADLTLSKNFTIASEVSCANTTLVANSTSTSPPGASQTAGAAAMSLSAGLVTAMLVTSGIMLAL